jgi:small GTP-binding protein
VFDDRPDRDAEVVLCGRSNVGKSTLMRELTGHAVETGSSPGVTREPNFYDWTGPEFLLTDLPGFGFMSGVPEDRRERIKTETVRYVERNADAILAAVLVLDGKAAVDVIDRHLADDAVPYDLDMHAFLRDVGIPTIIAVNKTDKIDDCDDRLDAIADRFGFPPPWQQWRDRIAPISAKREETGPLRDALRERLHEAKRDDLLGYVTPDSRDA